mmetsp:Transcript_9411/g.11621  ORF Transcript_9411/g.11621 Transcript_9411/m.11621 type:complete len:205 (-) Transcript_9411:33-647(-)
MRRHSVLRTSATTSNPAALIVVPVSTRSTTASARPRPQAASTEPETNLILVVTPFSLSNSSKNVFVSTGKLVTILFPARVETSVILLVTGACTQSLHFPNPSSITVSTSTALSWTTSYPVIPMSTLPSPTYAAMSAAGRKINVRGRLGQRATSRRGSRRCSIPAPFRICKHFSYNLPFLGMAMRQFPSGLEFATLDIVMMIGCC